MKLSGWSIVGLLFFGSLSFAQTQADVNDVSYLWPPPLSVQEGDRSLGLDRIVPREVFEQILAFASGRRVDGYKLDNPIRFETSIKQIKNWHLVAMRIDPCAPGLSVVRNLDECMQEVRLVAQPFTVNEWGVEYYDFALHILFEMDQGRPQASRKFRDLWAQLKNQKLKLLEVGVDTRGVPLTIHPGFRVEKFRRDLESILLSSLGKSRLKKITFSGSVTGKGPWIFFQGLVSGTRFYLEPDVNLRNFPHSSIIPKLPGEGGEILARPQNTNWTAIPQENYGPSVADLFYFKDINLDHFATLGNDQPSSQIRKRDIIPLLDNPRFSNRTNTDCMSCHTSTSRALQLGLDMSQSVFRFDSPVDITTKGQHLDKSITNLRAFGWFGSKASVSQRVVNESASVADFLNEF